MFFKLFFRTIIRKATSYVRHIYYVAAIEHVALTLKIFALTIRIGLLLPRTIQGSITCIFYPPPPTKAEKGPAESMRATKFEEIGSGRGSSLTLHVAQNLSFCCLQHRI